MMKKAFFFAAFVLFAVFSGIAFSHQPRIVSGGEVTLIEAPEVSKAYYGNLGGEPHKFRIESEEPFVLYVGLLVPAEKGAMTDFFVEARSENATLFVLDGNSHNWTLIFEEFAGDYYLKGPEKTAELQEGTYTITVSGPENQGKYVLVVGEKEEFPLVEIVKTLLILPKIKSDFFGKPAYTAYFNVFGAIMAALFSAIAILAYIVYRFSRKRH